MYPLLIKYDIYDNTLMTIIAISPEEYILKLACDKFDFSFFDLSSLESKSHICNTASHVELGYMRLLYSNSTCNFR